MSAVYSAEDIQSALYRFSDRLAGQIEYDSKTHEFLVRLDFFSNFKGDKVNAVRLFSIEVNDQSLRRKIKSETEATRNLVFAHAFSELVNRRNGNI